MEQASILPPIAPPPLTTGRPPAEDLYGRWLFMVYGTPVPQGSMKATVHRQTGRVVMFPSNNVMLKAWRNTIAREAAVRKPAWLREPWDGPVWVSYTYVFERSRNDYLADGISLRSGARRYPDVAPDKDKLDRAVNDALTGIAFTNDGRIVAGPSEKRYGAPGEPAHVEIEIALLR